MTESSQVSPAASLDKGHFHSLAAFTTFSIFALVVKVGFKIPNPPDSFLCNPNW